ncbi:MAG: ATP-dependent RNA helicase HrpA [Desulfosarcinaceae bacterium]|nr:ATP-dependent RNA helicase HrpA [Desulfosarcinaceae bacterium]
MTRSAPHIPSVIRDLLPRALHLDRIAVQRELRRIDHRRPISPAGREKIYAGLTDRLRRSVATKARRLARQPELSFDEQLPITAAREEIISAITDHPVIIVAGETGSGKTTQLPKFCLAAGRGMEGWIGCTQPRRIAASTVSRRIAEELGESLGETVGYKIRFQDKTRPDARIKVMTDGILLAETQGDPYLNAYDTLIVDEAHERSLNIDFLLGILRGLVKCRRDLKLLITSATIDTEKFSAAFDDAPVIEVSGRMYPVETRYRPMATAEHDKEDPTVVAAAIRAVDRIVQDGGRGDVLVFMPTEQDIRETCDIVEGRHYRDTTVLPLFARLSAAEQLRVFSRPVGRKIIVATNVAETSITIPGIRYVVDTGLARISQYQARTRTTALPVVSISRSSADQRQGRCGRVAGGICIRLYSEADYNDRPRFTQPEILRANLAEVILRMIALGLGDVVTFPFIDRPAEKNIQAGYQLLAELGAIAPNGAQRHRDKAGRRRRRGRAAAGPYRLTPRGRLMARLPLDPRLSRMLIEAHDQHVLPEVTVIAAALSVMDPRERPLEQQAAADQAHARFRDPASDFVTLLNLWEGYQKRVQNRKSWADVRRYCRQHFLNFRRMREWADIHGQIRGLLAESRLRAEAGAVATPAAVPANGRSAGGQRSHKEKPGTAPEIIFTPRYCAIHRAILSGFLSNIAQQKEKFFFRAAKDRAVMVFPGSGLFKTPGEWIVAAEMVVTSRLYARTVARIDPRWLEPLAGDLCRRSYRDPRWERKRGQVVVTEQVSLFGLVIEPGRPTALHSIDPAQATAIFIQSALIEGDLRQHDWPAFLTHNHKLAAEIRGLEDRLRRRDLLVDDRVLADHYGRHLEGVSDLRALKHRIRQQGGDDFLRLSRDQLLNYDPDQIELDRFPRRLRLGEGRYRVGYRFSPESADDGVTVKIPLVDAQQVPAEEMEWLVPGLLQEKITALLKGLPKPYRRRLAPVGETAHQICRELRMDQGALIPALSAHLKARFGLTIPAAVWTAIVLPDHLRMRIALMDGQGRVVKSGRDADLLQEGPVQAVDADALDTLRRRWERSGIAAWDLGDLPDSVTAAVPGKGPQRAYLALVAAAEGQVASLTLFTDRHAAEAAHPKGVQVLLMNHFKRELKHLRQSLRLSAPASNYTGYFGGQKRLERQLLAAVCRDRFHRNLRTQSDFASAVAEIGRSGIQQQGQALTAAVAALLAAYHECRTTLHRLESAHPKGPLSDLLADLRRSLDQLIPPNFIDLYDANRLAALVRYLQALTIRAERGVVDLPKDRARADQVKPFSEKLGDIVAGLDDHASAEKRQAVEDLLWMIEEYRISVFAQEIRTAFSVSPKRLKQQIAAIEMMV